MHDGTVKPKNISSYGSAKKQALISEKQCRLPESGLSSAGANRKTLAERFVGQVVVSVQKGDKELKEAY